MNASLDIGFLKNGG